MKPKMIWRLSLIMIVLAAIGGGVFWALQWRDAQADAHARQQREQGLADISQGRYAQALDKLRPYMKRYPNDVETLFQFAQASRQATPAPQAQIIQAMQALDHIVKLEPEHLPARHEMLKIFLMAGADRQVIDSAEGILKQSPQDEEAMRAKAFAQARLLLFRPALISAREYLKQKPLDIAAQLLVLNMMSKLEMPAADMVAYAQSVVTQHQDDPRAQTVMAVALRLAGDDAQATQWLRKAAAASPPTPEFAAALVQQLESLGLYDDAVAALGRAQPLMSQDADLRLLYVRRLWQRDQFDQLAQELASLEDDAQTVLWAYRAMLHIQQRDAAAVRDALAVLESRSENLAGQWVQILRSFTAGGGADAQQLLTAAQQAAELDPGEPMFPMFEGQALAAMGEPLLAAEVLETVARSELAWAAPCYTMAQSLLQSGRYDAAAQIAAITLRRSERHVGAAVVLAQAWAQLLERGVREDRDALVAHLQRAHEVAPDQPQITLLLIQQYLRDGQKEKAQQMAREMVSSQAPAPVLMQLANVVGDQLPALEHEAIEQLQGQQAQSPQTALAQARRLLEQGSADEGLSLLQNAGRDARHGAAWEVALAQYMQEMDHPEALETWRHLIAEYPNELAVQQSVASSTLVGSDAQLMQQVLTRWRKLTLDEGTGWRMARARWLLRSQATREDAVRALELVTPILKLAPDSVELRLIAARTHERLGDYQTAVRHMQAAVTLDPSSRLLTMQLARLMQEQGDFVLARRQIEKLLADERTTAAEKRGAAALLAEQGNVEAALQVLLALDHREQQSSETQLLLAELYRRQGEFARVNQICQQLMRSGNARALAFVASFYIVQGEQQKATAALGLLGELPLEPGQHEMIWAEHLAAMGQEQRAIAKLEEATRKAPQKVEAWRLLVARHLAAGEVPEAMAALERAMEAVPDDQLLLGVQVRRALVLEVAKNPLATSLLVSMLHDAETVELTAEALRAIASASDDAASQAALAMKLRQLADQRPRFLALQLAAVQAYLALGEAERASFIASRTAEMFPDAAQASGIAAKVLLKANRYEQALVVARQWRVLLQSRPLDADVAAAQALLGLGRHDEAVAQLQPHLKTALKNPGTHVEVIAAYARALMAQDKVKQAQDLLAPLLDDSPMWRTNWRHLAMGQSASIARSMLSRLEAATPTDAQHERLVLAQAWRELAKRDGDQSAASEARRIARAVAEEPQAAGAQAMLLLGVLAHETKDVGQAVHWYERALDVDASLNVARNNLAMLLMGSQPERARELARRAVAAEPDNGDYLDTLARIEAKLGDMDAAVGHQQRAVRLDPLDLSQRIHLVQLLRQAGQQTRARQAMDRLEEMAGYHADLTPAMQDQLETLRKQFSP